MRRLRIIAAGLCVAVAGAGCGSGGGGEDRQAATSPAVFTGRIDGTNAYVAVAPAAHDVTVYVCDGDELVAYLSGARAGDHVNADEPAQLVRLQGDVQGDEVTGAVTLPGGLQKRFVARRAAGDAGYFRTEVRRGDVVTTGGWIRLDDGSVRGKVASVSVVPSSPNTVTVTPVATDGGVGDGSSVPPDAEPFSFGAGVQCGIASIKVLRARRRLEAEPNFGNAGALDVATENANRVCNPATNP